MKQSDIERIFRETEFYFPKQIKKDYEKLIIFNNAISTERSTYLKKQIKDNKLELSKIDDELLRFNKKKSDILKHLTEDSSFTKYLDVRDKLKATEIDIARIEEGLENSSIEKNLYTKMRSLEGSIEILARQINEQINLGNTREVEIIDRFKDIIRNCVDYSATLRIIPNGKSNPEFKVITTEEFNGEVKSTGKYRGHTSKKLQSAAFVLALLATYRESNFYKFCYFDGVFEGNGDTPNKLFLEYTRQFCMDNDIQFIMTLIESDKPEDLKFLPGEVIRILNKDDRLLGENF